MLRKTMVGLTTAVILAGGGTAAYAATSASATAAEPQPTPSSPTPMPQSRDDMIRHCTDQLPSGERAEARRQMQRMMSSDHTAGHSMMNGGAGSGGEATN